MMLFQLETPVRALVTWFPDWPLVAARLADALPPVVPAAVIGQGVIAACSAEARAEGVVRGLRLREAQTRCPELVVCAVDPVRDAREFEPVVSSLEERTPGVEVLRPGLCATRARGASRYYGGEEAAAGAVLEAADRLGVEARVGIADSVFAAEQAARSTSELSAVLVLPPGSSRDFLAPFPVEVLGQPKLASLLKRLGILTLGNFADLPAADVRSRFGAAGVTAHALASGQDPRTVVPRTPPRKLDQRVEFEPGLDRVDQLAFQLRATADAFVAGVQAEGLVCTELRVLITDEAGSRSERTWGHPRHFTPSDVVDRVRWQLQSQPPVNSRMPDGGTHDGGVARGGLSSPVTRVEFVPVRVDSIAHHGRALFGDGAEEQIHHGLSRIQSMLGHEAVVVPAISGGRLLAERRRLVPWGDSLPAGAPALASRPWPGRIPDPQPATVFASLVPVLLLDANREKVLTDHRGGLLAPPRWFCPGGDPARGRLVVQWAGPWPLRQRWWDADHRLEADRFQLVDGTGEAWLLLLDGQNWWAEARYD
ncbi:DNA polymerase Y family protein [Arthrobacter bambusae]|uniref:DNA polymerase Y family protein n=1 Tax=Arthrobacter bambusae TaxID=1338426 RepID=UPI00277D811A|nr:DNA polymerase Y family protein [Arthrobacter bambusae]MDQ0030469.1 protein ImuB [Arthrobacter bambusae]MDQ0098386.1 protein ImuB [Arthrobacter bambusae]